MRHGEADYDRLGSFVPVYLGSRGDFAPLTEVGTGRTAVRRTLAWD